MSEPLRKQILTSLHSMDHKGIKTTTSRVANEFYWPSLKGDAKNLVKSKLKISVQASVKRYVLQISFFDVLFEY